MSALETERGPLDDDTPVPYTLSDAGWGVGRRLVTSAEAAVLAGVTRGRINMLADGGHLEGMLVNRRWLLDRSSVEAYAVWRVQQRLRARRPRRLPAEPLLSLLTAAGGVRAVGAARGSAAEKAIQRARRDGTVTYRAADQLTVELLGLTPWEVWGSAYDA
ncbi:hypothetical protein ABKW28_11720 [Nocardioides sp. 31GB23]|uniref:hypothetical protein n=1 Tax=Nocardioides sp. 31GB23 TaxID=3156065 RepID=UPI0032AF8194